jgi:hypothetical protein
MSGWVGFDLDGTLAEYKHFEGPTIIGKPIQKMVTKLKKHLSDGDEVRIFTARVFPLDTIEEALDTFPKTGTRTEIALQAKAAIEQWCLEHIGQVLPITCIKDYQMWKLYDDRACQVIPNTGECIEDKYNALLSKVLNAYQPEHDHVG